MDLEDRLDALESAHRALAAQHTALFTVCRVMLPLISGDASVKRPLLTVAYDASCKQMDELEHDAAQQAEVRYWLDVLTSDAAAAEYTSLRPESSGG